MGVTGIEGVAGVLGDSDRGDRPGVPLTCSDATPELNASGVDVVDEGDNGATPLVTAPATGSAPGSVGSGGRPRVSRPENLALDSVEGVARTDDGGDPVTGAGATSGAGEADALSLREDEDEELKMAERRRFDFTLSR